MTERLENPFTPIFSKIPAYLAGRTQLVDEMDFALKSSGNDPALVSVFVGARGSGKTTLLSLFANMAEERGWVSARVTSSPDMLEEILLRINRSTEHLLEPESKRKLTSIGLGAVGFWRGRTARQPKQAGAREWTRFSINWRSPKQASSSPSTR